MDTADDVTLPQSAYGNPYAFTGREFDPESGLYYSRARYYDPQTGRFLQADPVFHLNPYPYVDNNPINFTDPLGLFMAKGTIKKKLLEEGYGNQFSDKELNIIAEEIDSTLNPVETAKAGNPNISENEAKEIANSCRAELRAKYDERLEEKLIQKIKAKPGSKQAKKVEQELEEISATIRLLQEYDAATEKAK